MFYRKFFIAIVIALIYLLNGCATSLAPENWLPDTDQIQREAFGGWLTVSITDSSGNPRFGGEFIASDIEKVYLLTDSMLKVVSQSDIQEAVLEIDDKNTETYSGLALLGTLSTLSHGFYLILSAPTWIIVGSSVASEESRRDRYVKEISSDIYWKEINKFARFPQGLPPNLNLIDLHPKKLSSSN